MPVKTMSSNVNNNTAGNSNELFIERPRTSRLMVSFSMFIAITGLIYNFDLGYGGIVLIMMPFRRDFGTCTTSPDANGMLKETCTLTALQQSLVSITFLFVALGSAIAGPTGYFLGRRGVIQAGCVLVAAGAGGMLGTTGNYTGYLVCKCLGGVGLGFFNAAAPAYGVECTTPSKRGMLTSLFGFGLGCGSAVAAAVCLGTSKLTSSLAWQIPIICQIPLSLMLGVGVLLFPESPRWLLLKGKETSARKAFARFYGVGLSDPLVSKQVQEVHFYIELEQHQATTTSWTELFHKTNIRRTMISWLVSIGQAICGGRFVSVYASVFLSGVGINNPYLITLIVLSMAVAGGVVLPIATEYGGRRFAVVTGYASAASCMLIIGTVATGLGPESAVAKNVLIVFLCLWTFVYGGFIGAGFPVIAPELYTLRLRTFGMASSATMYEIFAFAAAFYTPYMLNKSYGNMGTNVAYFYFGIDLVLLILVYWLVPETASLSLEQIDDHFNSGNKAWRTSLAKNKKLQREHAFGTSGLDHKAAEGGDTEVWEVETAR